MTTHGGDYDAALDRAVRHSRAWLASLGEAPVAARVGADEIAAVLDAALPTDGMAAPDVIDALATGARGGLMASQSGRFFGWVMGGTLPAALGADWLVSAWDQNAGMRRATPAAVALEECAARWLLDVLGLPAGAGVGYVTGATMANFTCLAAARDAVLAARGWDVRTNGLAGAPRVQVFAGAERHDTVDLALGYLGLGRATTVPADGQGRLRVEALTDALAAVEPGAPVLVCLQAGNIHSGGFDPFAEAVRVAHARGAWVHVDGAFGLWAAASPRLAHLVDGVAGADSWATDAHKTLNVPYDCGIAIVADPAAMNRALGVHASYLLPVGEGPGDPYERVPELSRRARGVPVWAALRSLGRSGVADLVDGLAANARALAEGISGIDGAQVRNDVVFTQVCVAFEDDDRTRAVAARLAEDGDVLASGSRWHDRAVLRFSVSNWSTDAADVTRAVDAVRAASRSTRPRPAPSRAGPGVTC